WRYRRQRGGHGRCWRQRSACAAPSPCRWGREWSKTRLSRGAYGFSLCAIWLPSESGSGASPITKSAGAEMSSFLKTARFVLSKSRPKAKRALPRSRRGTRFQLIGKHQLAAPLRHLAITPAHHVGRNLIFVRGQKNPLSAAP